MEVVVGLFIVVMLVGLYFLPTIVAADRKVPNFGSVLVINLFLGWTLVGWVVALAMAVRDRKTETTPATAPRSADVDQLEKLADLHRAGVLTDDEFAAAKRRALA